MHKSHSLSQCFDCQTFGHLSFHYGFFPRCLKHEDTHRASEYSKTKYEEPKCSNYDIIHMANFKKHPCLLKEISDRKPINNKLFSPSTQQENAPTTAQPIESYAVETKLKPHSNFKIAEKLQNLLFTISTGEIDHHITFPSF